MKKPSWLSTIEQRLIIRNYTQNISQNDSNQTQKNAWIFADLTQKYNNQSLEMEQLRDDSSKKIRSLENDRQKMLEKHRNLTNIHKSLQIEKEKLTSQLIIIDQQRHQIEILTNQLQVVTEESNSKKGEIDELIKKQFDLVEVNSVLEKQLMDEKQKIAEALTENTQIFEQVSKMKTHQTAIEKNPKLAQETTTPFDFDKLAMDDGLLKSDILLPKRGKLKFVAHEQDINWIECSHLHSFFATASVDKSVRVWDVVSGKRMHILDTFASSATCVAFSSGDEYMAVAQYNGSAFVYMPPRNYKVVFQNQCHQRAISCVTFNNYASGQELITGSKDASLQVWNISQGRKLYRLGGPGSDVSGCYAVSSLPNGTICSGHHNGTVRLWDPSSHLQMDVLKPGNCSGCITGVTASPDGRFLFIVSRDNTVVLHDVIASKALFTHRSPAFRTATDSCRGVFSPSGRYVCVGSAAGDILSWDVIAKKEDIIRTRSDHGPGEGVVGISYAFDGSSIVSYDKKKNIVIWV